MTGVNHAGQSIKSVLTSAQQQPRIKTVLLQGRRSF